MCVGCKHFMGFIYKLDSGESIGICTAYPSGIPNEIYYQYEDHTKPFPGDNGILFEPI